jgi:hypothetical protein
VRSAFKILIERIAANQVDQDMLQKLGKIAVALNSRNFFAANVLQTVFLVYM